jgi:phage shock protein A
MHSPFAYEAFDSISHQLEDGRRNAAVLAERVSHIEKLVQALGELNQVVNLHQDIVKHREEATKNKTEEWDYHLQLEEAKHQFQIRVNQALVEQIQSLADTLQRIETKLNHKPTWRERIRGYFGW